MLSINGMLGPSSPTSQSRREDPNFSTTSPATVSMSQQQDRTGLQSLLNTPSSPEPISPEGSYSQVRSFSEEITSIPPHKRKHSHDDHDHSPSPHNSSPKKKRAPRPQYTKEQEDFIWFCRDDLAMSWRKVVQLYNNHWHPFESEPHIRSESGLQSRYYRILDFPVKIRKKKEPSRPDLGLIPSTNRRYEWMGVIKASIEEKKNAERNKRYATNVSPQLRQEDDGEREDGSESDIGGLDSRERGRARGRWASSRHNTTTSPELRANSGARMGLHVEGGEHEWESSRRSPVGTGGLCYDRGDSKSVISSSSCDSSSPTLDPIKTRFQNFGFTATSISEGPIHLPPLRSFPQSGIHYPDEFRKQTYEMAASNHISKISVFNLCI